MPHLNELSLHPLIEEALSPLVGDKTISEPGKLVVVDKGHLRLELEDAGEGWGGDYDPDDETDIPLMRFTFSARNAEDDFWFSLDETSYCTSIDARAPWEVQVACACLIFDLVYPKLPTHKENLDPTHGRLVSRLCEQLSHASDSGHDALRAALQAVQLEQNAPEISSTTHPRARL